MGGVYLEFLFLPNKAERIKQVVMQIFSEWLIGVQFDIYLWNTAEMNDTNIIRLFVSEVRVLPLPTYLSLDQLFPVLRVKVHT